ncbi:MAG: TonB-dependent receptor [Myxococcota bacterium]
MPRRQLAVLVSLLSAAGAAFAQDEPDPDVDPDIDVIVVEARGTQTATTLQVVPSEDFELRPLESGGQMLEAVPGVLTAQHTGGGKAEQYFLRGFDADHGTDLAVYFDGVPVNLRSHAHGQGFLDLHFVTKESIERLDVQKGPYSTRFGDFATAATIEFVPYERVEESSLKFEGGEYETLRGVGVWSPDWAGADALVAVEAYHTDGPFRFEEDLDRYSAYGSAGVDLGSGVRLSGHVLGYTAQWDASGLVPERLVDADQLSRFGSVDPTEGGESSRVQGKLQLDWDATPDTRLTTNAYVVYYDLDLYSNFTYRLNDPDAGDGILQRDRRVQAGGRSEWIHRPDLPWVADLTAGFEWRIDDARVRLGNQTDRQTTSTTNDDDVLETSLAPYAQLELAPLPWIDLVGGLRYEAFLFDVDSNLVGGPNGDGHDDLWMPKATLVLSPFGEDGPLPARWDALRSLDLFAHVGVGYHSNDARSTAASGSDRLIARATGAEFGLRSFVFDRLYLSAEAFWLELEDELVFVGDEGTTESGGRSRRLGVEAAAQLFLTDWLYARGDLAYVEARSTGSDEPIVQAPRFVAKGAVGVRWQGLAVELGMRHLGERYASEDFLSPRLSDYTVFDLGAAWRHGPIEVGVAVENLADTEWRSSEFFYESCAPGEVGVDPRCPAAGGGTGIADFHFTPGNRRNVRGWVRWIF